jgi:hypothetical protein
MFRPFLLATWLETRAPGYVRPGDPVPVSWLSARRREDVKRRLADCLDLAAPQVNPCVRAACPDVATRSAATGASWALFWDHV